MISQQEIDDLEVDILLLEEDSKIVHEKMIVCRKALTDVESSLIDINITRDILKEKLRVTKSKKVDTEMSDRENDIERFKKILPELLGKIKG